jgi:hypothetical protein
MKNKLLTLLIFCGYTFTAVSQDLFVANDSYVFVTDEVLFVQDDIRLDTNTSNIYLRNLAQLIQSSDTKNSDEGDLSVIQDQTVGVYEYNYWSSPVGDSNNASNTNANFDVRNMFHDTGLVASTQYTANAPTTGFLEGTTTEISTYWLYTLENGTGYADWQQAGNTNLAVRPGYGFTMKGNGGAGNDYDFRGRPNNGDITVNIGAGGAETLSGNPYPSALDVKLFLIDPANAALDGSTYYWQQVAVNTHYLESYQGGYASYAVGNPSDLSDNGTYTIATFQQYDANGIPTIPSGGSSTAYSEISTRFAPIGQGFMLRGASNGTATFDNSMRVYLQEGASSIFRSQQSIIDEIKIPISHNGVDYESAITNPTIVPELRIHTKINDAYYRENVIAFRGNSTPSFEKYFDAKHPLALESGDTYFATEEAKLVINSIDYSEDEVVPFGLYVGADQVEANFSVSLNLIDNFEDNINVFVYDKQTGSYTDIINGSFDITLPSGDHNERFEIVFKDAQQDQADDIVDVLDTAFDIFQDNNNGVLTIKNPDLINIKTVGVFDVSGKLVFNKTNLQAQELYSFPSNNLSDGIYIVRLITADNVDISEKVSVYNRK